ncbi:MAG: hypothetical protein M1833_006488 [Piccolia ochrophora]|nr:MAG: hypothetical protein M1833_006488 [Piccolia ochrophora]
MASYLRLPFLAGSSLAALFSGLLYFKQNDIIYPRNIPLGTRTEVPRPRDFGHDDYEELLIPTPDGESLSAFLIRPENKSRTRDVTMLMFHGNAGNIGHRVPIALQLQEDLGCNVLMLEYRGYGLSTGTPDEKGLMIDGQTALDYIGNRADIKHTKIVVYGQSLGGALGIQLVARNQHAGRISALILENTFTSIRAMIPSAFPPAKYLARLCHQVWPSESTLPSIQGIPVLFLSGLKDEIVPPAHMKQLYQICRAQRKIWRTLPNGTHNDTMLQENYFLYVTEFMDEVFTKIQQHRL